MDYCCHSGNKPMARSLSTRLLPWIAVLVLPSTAGLSDEVAAATQSCEERVATLTAEIRRLREQLSRPHGVAGSFGPSAAANPATVAPQDGSARRRAGGTPGRWCTITFDSEQ